MTEYKDRDWINDLDKYDGFCIIKFVDDERYFCRIISNGNMVFGLGTTTDEAYRNAKSHLNCLDETTTLKSCPFCGDPNPKLEELPRLRPNLPPHFVMVCSKDNCDVMGPTRNTAIEAMYSWNNRMEHLR